jgi:ketosteroid isomerase-like protein
MLALLAAPALFAQDAAKAVEAAERGWSTGSTKNDFALLGKLLANDLTYTHSTGAVDTKESYIGNLKSGKARYVSINYDQLKVQVLGPDIAITICRAAVTTMKDGKPSPVKLSLLHVFRKQGAQWQLVAHQSARLPD